MQTISYIIQLAQVSGYLADNDIVRSEFLNNGYLDPLLPTKIYMERKALEWAYGQTVKLGSSPDAALQSAGNYVVTLCGKYGVLAQNIIGGGTGSVVIPASTPVYYIPVEVQFIVDGSSPMPTDSSTLVINDTGINISSFKIFSNTSLVPYNVNTQYSYTYVQSPTYLTLTFNIPAQADQLISYSYLKAI